MFMHTKLMGSFVLEFRPYCCVMCISKPLHESRSLFEFPRQSGTCVLVPSRAGRGDDVMTATALHSNLDGGAERLRMLDMEMQ